MSDVRMVPEPVAAGRYFATTVRPLPPGDTLLVYDLGAGTFDASLLRNTPDGFDVLAVDGLEDFGGLDIDALVVDQVFRGLQEHEREAWRRLTESRSVQARRAHGTLWDDARSAKEALSRQSSAVVQLPVIDREVYLGREAIEGDATPLLQRTVERTQALLRQAGMSAADVAAVVLVGGATRMPLVGTLLHRALGVAPTVADQPELMVAEGALHRRARADIGLDPRHGAGTVVDSVRSEPHVTSSGPSSAPDIDGRAAHRADPPPPLARHAALPPHRSARALLRMA